MKKRFILILVGLGIILFFPRANSQNSQISPVSNLQGSNASVINNNMQILQNGINGATYQIQQYFPGGILQGKMGGTGFDSANIASGDTIVSSNGTWILQSFASHGYQIFTSSGIFTSPITGTVFINMTGGGGGGGGNNSIANGGGGGGAGGTFVNVPYSVTSGNTYTVTVGNGGNGGSIGNGSNGTPSVFDVLSVSGGNGGSVATGGGPGAGGTGGGSAGNGAIPNAGILASLVGGSGSIGGSAGDGGGGGGSYIGAGGVGGTSTNGTSASVNTGAGGGGATSAGGTLYSGGNGGSGFVMVAY